MNNLIVYAGDHTQTKLMAGILIVSCIVLIVWLLVYMRNKNKK